ncbi:hypothetical protein GCG21_09630 [Pseudactinotalea sp. HY160]|nr:hypothetical protein [Pseudactinotalea sp. HY160]
MTAAHKDARGHFCGPREPAHLRCPRSGPCSHRRSHRPGLTEPGLKGLWRQFDWGKTSRALGPDGCCGHSPRCRPTASSRRASQRIQAMPRTIVLGWSRSACTGLVS